VKDALLPGLLPENFHVDAGSLAVTARDPASANFSFLP